MKFIEPSVELVEENNPYKKVEKIGRMCYKSEDKITEDSYKIFFKNLVTRRHLAMLEHGVVSFLVQGIDTLPSTMRCLPYIVCTPLQEDDRIAWLITVSLSRLYADWDDMYPKDAVCIELLHTMKLICESNYQTNGCNYAAILNNMCTVSIVEDLKNIQNQFPAIPILMKHQYISMKFVCDRGVSHELVRHRCSVAQSSTRYCNYSKDKFGAEITYVYPSTYSDWSEEAKEAFENSLKSCETTYMLLVANGYTPQQARAVLPNALMTEVVLTMPAWQWGHFLNLRYFGITGDPHPDMKVVAGLANEIFHSAYLGEVIDTE